MSDYYFTRTLKKFHFIITPDELPSVLAGLHHMVANTGVDKDYIESDPNEFIHNYSLLYNRLKKGDRLIWKHDYNIVSISSGLTMHLENCRYTPRSKLSIPNFIEPCVVTEPFCFNLTPNGQLSTSYYIGQFPENVCGLQLFFPNKIEYRVSTEKHREGIVPCDELDDYITYQTLIRQINTITKPLKLKINERIYRPTVRISQQAKADFANFYFVVKNNAEIL